MGWNMYQDGKARLDMRIKQQLTVEDIALIIAEDTTMDGKRVKFVEGGAMGETEEVEWTQKAIEEQVRYELEQFGYHTVRSHEENLGDWLGENKEKEEKLEVAKQVVADKFNIDEMREKYGYDKKYNQLGGSRRKEVDVQGHTRRTQKGKPTKVKSHKRSKPNKRKKPER